MNLYASFFVFRVWCALLSVPLFGGLFLTLKDPAKWDFFAIPLVFLIFVFLWFKAFRIRLDKDRISYRSLFKGETTIELLEIENISSEIGFEDQSDRYRPLKRLVIRDRSGKNIIINLKLLSKDGTKELVKFFSEKGYKL